MSIDTEKTRRASQAGSTPYRHHEGWAAKVTLYDALGKAYRKTIYGPTPEAVEAKRQEIQAKRDADEAIPDDRVLLGRYLEHWVTVTLPEQVINGVITQSTADSYAERTRNHLIPDLGHIRFIKLTAPQIRTWKAQKRTEISVRGTPHSVRTVEYLQAILRRALGDAIADGIYGLDQNVAIAEKVGRTRRAKAHKGKPFSTAEVKRVLTVITDDPRGPLWITIMALGLRKAQALDLIWAGVDLDNAVALIPPSKERRGEVPPEPRPVSLPASLVEVLRQHRQAQRKERAKAKLAGKRWVDTDYVFTSGVGSRLMERNVNRFFDAVLVRAGIDHRRVHDLRHTAASHRLAAGEDLKVVSDLLNHSRIGTTADLYTKVLAERKRQSADLMDDLMVKQWGLRTGASSQPEVG